MCPVEATSVKAEVRDRKMMMSSDAVVAVGVVAVDEMCWLD